MKHVHSNNTHSLRRRLLLLALPMTILSFTLTGCGSSIVIPGEVPTAPVTGKLSFKGKAPVGAQIVLHPTSGDATAPRPIGTVQKDGTFTLTSFRGNDGAPPGEYVLTARWNKLKTSPEGDAFPGPNVLPEKYGTPQKSPLKIRIAEGPNDLQTIALK